MKTLEPETIVAPATPEGEGAIGVIRVSGPRSLQLLSSLFRPGKSLSGPLEPFRLYPGWIADDGEKIDQVMAAAMPGPKSYTGEDMVEIHCHGGRAVISAILDALIRRGARPAEAGEFTRRAFLHGKIDLTRAESVAWLISARSEEERLRAVDQIGGGLGERLTALRRRLVEALARVEVTLDFEEFEEESLPYPEVESSIREAREELCSLEREARAGEYLREGLKVVIVGKPNVGKSSLLNTFLARKRAIVSRSPGTTRDTIEEVIVLDGVPLKLIDTAGLRRPRTGIEEEGVARAREKLAGADLVLLVLDSGTRITDNDREILRLARDKRTLIVVNKTDLPARAELEGLGDGWEKREVVRISAEKNWGMERLREEILALVRKEFLGGKGGGVMISSRRRTALKEAAAALETAAAGCRERLSGELIALDLNRALARLRLVLGEEFDDGVLDEIFSRFCVGK
ncbi:MAG: tRNA uridine-5-carboxymethylaminomethyl(34) synthesis GTPase MnmE [Candidatus Erginobacter occultus]|nr:tRNA uridine-5-carboxymethylaminomethyl(34) synthesis GTPase MnmE [Candidatus Erginobacter occultus]